jgi:hypothetical protein
MRVVWCTFNTFGFRMGDEADGRPVNCALKKSKGGWRLDRKRG